MGEREDVTRSGRGGSYKASTVRPAPAVRTGREDPEAIRADIEQTRAEMSETIDEIQDKLSPGNIKERMRTKFRDATIGRVKSMAQKTGDAGSTFARTVRNNPLPAAMVGIGLGMLIMRSRREGNGGRQYRYARAGEEPGTMAGTMESMKSTAESLREQARAKSGEYLGRAQEKAGEWKEKASQFTGQARAKAGEWSGTAQEKARQAQGWFQETMDTNPLGLGLALLAAGAVIGLSIPVSRKEKELLGETGGSVMGSVREAAQDTFEKARYVAQEAAHTARKEAERQGLTK